MSGRCGLCQWDRLRRHSRLDGAAGQTSELDSPPGVEANFGKRLSRRRSLASRWIATSASDLELDEVDVHCCAVLQAGTARRSCNDALSVSALGDAVRG